MTDIVIRRCTMQVTRHGGWSWGVDRNRLAERMARIVPQLVAARLAELFDGRDGDIAEPVRLRIALPSYGLKDDQALDSAVRAALNQIVALQGLSIEAGPDGTAEARQAIDPGSDGDVSMPIDAIGKPVGTVSELLTIWRSNGQLVRRVKRLTEATALLWLRRLLATTPSVPMAVAGDAGLGEQIAAILTALPPDMRTADRANRSRLIVAAELIARHRTLPPADRLMPMLGAALLTRAAHRADAHDGTIEPSQRAVDRDRAASARQSDGPQAGPVESALPVSRPRRLRIGQSDIDLTSVLPFLMLAMLSRTGWLDVVAATIDGLSLPDDGAIFAFALAQQVIAHPFAPGRDDAVLRTAATFAGLERAPSPDAVTRWAAGAANGLSPITAFVADAIADGHDATQPVLIMRSRSTAGSPWIVVDRDGGYPVAVTDDIDALLIVLRQFRASVVLVAADAASPELLRRLAHDDIAYVERSSPTRHEQAIRLAGPEPLWGTAHDMPLARLEAAAGHFTELESEGNDLYRLLFRQSADRAGATIALDEAIMLSASLGLGLLATQLWHPQESVTPLLALDRLGGLDGSARVTPTMIEIRPSIGRRYLDLKRCGALHETSAIAWLGGRAIGFVGP